MGVEGGKRKGQEIERGGEGRGGDRRGGEGREGKRKRGFVSHVC